MRWIRDELSWNGVGIVLVIHGPPGWWVSVSGHGLSTVWGSHGGLAGSRRASNGLGVASRGVAPVVLDGGEPGYGQVARLRVNLRDEVTHTLKCTALLVVGLAHERACLIDAPWHVVVPRVREADLSCCRPWQIGGPLVARGRGWYTIWE